MPYISIFEEEYSSIEEYIQKSIEQSVPWISFKNLEDFEILYKKELLKAGMYIRTSDKGIIDEMYKITKEGKLEGITNSDIPYLGKKGIFKPENILMGKRISSGWSICTEGKFSFNFKLLIKNGPGGI